MKTSTVVLVISLISISVSCKNRGRDVSLTKHNDSMITLLSVESDNHPDSVLARATSFLPTIDNDTQAARILLVMASAYESRGQYDSSIASAQKAIDRAGKNKRLLAELYNQLGIDYDYKSDYKQALTNYQAAQQYYQEIRDSAGYIRIKNNIGLIYQNSGNLERAKEYFRECLSLSEKGNLVNEEIDALSNLASIENDLNNFDTALLYYKAVLQSDLSSGNEKYISFSYHNMGETYKNLRQFDSAAYYYTRSIAIKEKLSLQGALVNSYKGYADMLIETGNYPEAQFYLDKSFRLVRQTGNTDYLKDCFYLQSRLAEKKGDYKTAYFASDSFYILKDSIAGAQFTSELVAKEKDHEYNLSEKLNQQQIDKLQIEKITFILFMIFFAVVAVTLFFLFRKQRITTRQLRIQKKQTEEGLAMRTQLLSFIAHEIRNPLGGMMGLTDLMLNNNPEPSQKELLVYQKKASSHLLSLMNDVLDYQKLGSGKVELNSIRFNLKDVLYQVYGLYQVDIREKNLVYELNYDEQIPEALMGDPVRLTQVFSNLLNNAIKFTDKGKVSISVQLQNRLNNAVVIDCCVSDSGIGIPKDEQEKIFELYVQSSTNKASQLGTGLGLSIVRNLLQLMNSKIQISSTPNQGTTFSFPILFRLPQ